MKKFKGENIEKIRFTDNYIVENDVPRKREYKGYVKVGWEHPHGEGINIIRNKDKSIHSIEEGTFENGLLMNGTEIVYNDLHSQKISRHFLNYRLYIQLNNQYFCKFF